MLVIFGAIFFLLGAAVFLAAGLLWAYTREDEYRGPRRILCPETLQPATVSVDARLAVRGEFAGRPRLRLAACSRWPERRQCDQACAAQVPLVGDSRRATRFAPFGLHPRYLRINNPVRMTSKMYAKLTGT
jgi:hypothetical protein